MDIYVDLNTKAVEFGAVGGAVPQRVKIKQTEDIRLKFHRGGAPELISASDAMFIGIKDEKDSDDTLASETSWTHPGTTAGFYTCSLNLNTTQITTDLFDADGETRDEIEVILEFTRTPSGGTVRRYDDARFHLVRPVFTGDEGTPADATTPALYSTTAAADLRYLRWLSTVTGLTGGGSTKLDGLATVAITAGHLVCFAISAQMQHWELQAGTTAEDSANGIVRPDDYNASTNAKIWIRIA